MTQRRIAYLCIAVLLALTAYSIAERAHAQNKGQEKGAVFTDAVISKRVKAAIGNDAALRTMDISIEVQDSVVHLRGFVNSLADVAKAESLARAVQGVTGVKNAIRVANRPSRA